MCERCLEAGRVTATTECHHIISIADAPHLMMERSNIIAVCHQCHEELEGKKLPSRKVRTQGGPPNGLGRWDESHNETPKGPPNGSASE